ncbi:nucleotide exchange factor GrpE [Allokutzneria oryzae]|uniref:Protein GrpE n=1 Tax=Allokutzneria oryzae TaxID=1378989 RepID=A0ABV5ZRN8_9PSEU
MAEHDERAAGSDADDEMAELRAQVARLEDQWRRTAAELDNLRKRTVGEAERQRWRERGEVAAAWLPVVDNLDLALQHADADPASIVEGVRGIRDQALTVLARLGFPRREDHGAEFDPVRHEAVSSTPDAHAPPGTVVAVLRPGYGQGEWQLRPASVVVATPPEPAEPPGGGETDDGERGR